LLASCYRVALDLARAQGCASIAFPAISTGVYGYPGNEAAEVAVGAVSDWLASETADMLVILVSFDAATMGHLRDACASLGVACSTKS